MPILKKAFAITIFLLLLPSAAAASSAAEALQRISDLYVDMQRPGNGGRSDLSATGFGAEILEKEAMLQSLLSIEPAGLDSGQDIDRRLLIGILRSDINTARTLRRWENDPALYLPSSRLGQLLESVAADNNPGNRQPLLALLDRLPVGLSHGRANLKRPPERFTRAAIFQVENSLESLDQGIEGLAGLTEPEQASAARALDSLTAYLVFLKEDLLPRSDGDWALGRDAYDFVLRERWHMDADADQIHQRGLQAFEETEVLAQQTAERMQAGKPRY